MFIVLNELSFIFIFDEINSFIFIGYFLFNPYGENFVSSYVFMELTMG